jgi:hypothetical protein
MGISSIKADSCFDQRIVHPIALMAFQALGVAKEVCISMLSTIQDMKFFLRIGFGDSTACAGSTGGLKLRACVREIGLLPPHGQSPIAIIQAHKQKGHGVHLICPISKKPLHLAGMLFVDDTDIKHFNMMGVETVVQAHASLQDNIFNWGRLLVITGGVLNPAICFYHKISFSWNRDRK